MPERHLPIADPWEPLRGELAADVRRVADRLRSLSQARLAGAIVPSEGVLPPGGTRAEAAHRAAEELTRAASALERPAAGGAPVAPQALPRLADFAVGDQVAVAGHDLLAALDLVDPDDEVPDDAAGARSARDVVRRAAQLLADVRRRL